MTVRIDVLGNFSRLIKIFRDFQIIFRRIQSFYEKYEEFNNFMNSMKNSIILWIVFWLENSLNLWILQRSQEEQEQQQQFSNL